MTKYLMGGKEASSSPELLPIYKNVPIPERTDNLSGRTSALRATARQMQIGDCILVPYTGSATITNMNQATGFKFTQRKEGDKSRIWRIA